jgi:hypothetical protein
MKRKCQYEGYALAETDPRGDYLEQWDWIHRGADKFLAWPTSRCILFDGQNISFDVILVLYI